MVLRPRPTDESKVCEIEKEAKVIAKKLELGDQIFNTSKIYAHITFKDRKSTFSHKLTSRLLNPIKPEMGMVSKEILNGDLRGEIQKQIGMEKATLNKRLEIFTNCRHKARLTLEPKEIKDD